jgi:hypothetical protein
VLLAQLAVVTAEQANGLHWCAVHPQWRTRIPRIMQRGNVPAILAVLVCCLLAARPADAQGKVVNSVSACSASALLCMLRASQFVVAKRIIGSAASYLPTP